MRSRSKCMSIHDRNVYEVLIEMIYEVWIEITYEVLIEIT